MQNYLRIRIHCKPLLMLLLFVLLNTVMSNTIFAKPQIDAAFKYGDVLLLPDHLDKNKFYYMKGLVEINMRDAKPDFNFTINRYIGKTLLGDDGKDWVRGVLKFSTLTQFGQNKFAAIENYLRAEYGKNSRLVPATINYSNSELIYQLISDNSVQGTLQINKPTVETTSEEALDDDTKRVIESEKQYYILGLKSRDAELFWTNFERNNLQLSVAYTWEVKGKKKDQKENWVDSSYQLNNTIPIKVSMLENPQLFKKNELWQKVKVAHTNLMIHCYDFINSDETNLYRVDVDVRFKTLNDNYYQESVRFTSESDEYDKKIDFRLVSEFANGFEFRIQRMTLDGDLVKTDWKQAKGAFLDVSMSSEELDAKHAVDMEEEIADDLF